MALQTWELVVGASIGATFLVYASRVLSGASPDKLRGEVHEIRKTGLWKLDAGKLLVIRHDTHNTATVRLQFRKPGAAIAIELPPGEAQHLALMLRAAANYDHARDCLGGSESDN